MSLRDWKWESQKQAQGCEEWGAGERRGGGKGRETRDFGPQARVGVGACPRDCKADSDKAVENQKSGATLKACHVREL